ncbi:epoxide hydrolase family protein [Actinospica robiniae]|uniref:epoxide hydrolase family protein n=1 Tax=Actinospica robiniae TaxID=304901 RepID=UPI000407D5DC|nr:epoxide hydrolase family protein [Actinospica robiniae]
MSASSKSTSAAIRPFTVPTASESELEDLRSRIRATRWPDPELVDDHSQGPKQDVLKKLAQYWADDYDMRRVEQRLSALPNYITEIDGLNIHFLHIRSQHENALPIIMTHGWPGSVVEFLSAIDPLVNPTAYGGSEDEAFHVVIPSMPGYGYSDMPRETGWGPERIARAWSELMRRLGYENYVAQGGDWGAIVTDLMGVEPAPGLLGIHSNMPGVLPADVAAQINFVTGGPAPDGLSAEEQKAWDQMMVLYTVGVGYAVEMATQPQTLYGLNDSPIGLAGWMLNHDYASYEDIAEGVRGRPVGNLTPDEVLDNITYYWLTNTGVSSGRLYWENKLGFFDAKGVKVPAAVSVFPKDLYEAPRSWAEKAYPKLVYFNEVDRGGHFAAWQEPELFASEVRAGLKSLR